MSVGALYSAFEIYPSSKGASTHMLHMIKALKAAASPLTVCCIAGEMEIKNNENACYLRFDERIPHYLDRARNFSLWLNRILEKSPSFEIAQFRDIWSGLPIIESGKAWFTVFEVNGLPSIELPYRYPAINTETIRKFRSIEMYCLTEADMILCPSKVIKDYIRSLGIIDDKIRVVSNGADIPGQEPASPSIPEKYIIYFGAIQKWQGLDVLIKAFNRLTDFEDLKLVICSSQDAKFSSPYKGLINRLRMNDRVIWHHQLDKNRLNSLIRGSLFTVAPLKDTARNIVQGCSPLKIFESMAGAKATIASDIPAVREIITDGFDGILVRPDRPSHLARAMRRLIDYPWHANELGLNALGTIREKYQWRNIEQGLKEFYLSNMVLA